MLRPTVLSVFYCGWQQVVQNVALSFVDTIHDPIIRGNIYESVRHFNKTINFLNLLPLAYSQLERKGLYQKMMNAQAGACKLVEP